MRDVINLGVGSTVNVPIEMGHGLCVLGCASKHPAIATCSVNGASVDITGRCIGSTPLLVTLGAGSTPAGQVVLIVHVHAAEEE